MSEESRPSDNSGDSSVYLDIQSPAPVSPSNSGELSWDNQEEELSFYQPVAQSSPEHPRVGPFVFSENREEHLAVWPPPHLSSETDPHFLEAGEIKPDLSTLEEGDVEDDVFAYDSDIEEVTEDNTVMPPKAKPTFEECTEAFEGSYKVWQINVKRILDRGNPVSNSAKEDLRQSRDDLEAKAAKLFMVVDKNQEDQKKKSDEIETHLCQVGNDLDQIYLLKKEGEANDDHHDTQTDNDPDLQIEKEVKKLTSIFEHWFTQMENVSTELTNLVQTQASTKSVRNAKDLLQKSMDIYKKGEEIFLKIQSEVSVFSSRDKLASNKNKLDEKWKQFRNMNHGLKSEVDEFVDKLPAEKEKEREKPTTNPLERLPLPKFSGKKMEYSRFKIEFNKHVKYNTEDEKVLALKEKCLEKKADKERVANKSTLKECWEILDQEHGDTETTVCDIFKQWRNLKTPTTDKALVEFVDQVENGVACLNALDASKELTASAVLNLEELLDKDKQNDLSLLIIQKPKEKTRMDIVMKFLRDHKSAAQLRINNYNNKTPNIKKESSTSSGNTSFRGRGRGGKFSGRGGGGKSSEGDKKSNSSRGRGRGRGRGSWKDRRAENNDKCLLCGDQHALARCPRWQDTEQDKFYLVGFVAGNQICSWCLEKGHGYRNCTSTEEHGCPCGSNYNMYICVRTEDCIHRRNWDEVGSGNSGLRMSRSSFTVNGTRIGGTILPIQKIRVSGTAANTMFDNCSQNSFVSNDFAKRLNLHGKNISFVLICTDGTRTRMNSKLFSLTIIDINGDCHQIDAISIPELSTKYPGFSIRNIKNKVPDGHLLESKLNREGGAIDLLIGTDRSSIHPTSIAKIGELVILQSQFGSGYTVMGHNANHVKFTDSYRGTRANVCAVEMIEDEETSINAVGTKDQQFLECISTESLGVNAKPKCKSCKVVTESCKECQVISKNMSYLEHLQDQQIENLIEKIPDAPGYLASYPYNKEINLLLPNKEICLKRIEIIEEKMKKSPAVSNSIGGI